MLAATLSMLSLTATSLVAGPFVHVAQPRALRLRPRPVWRAVLAATVGPLGGATRQQQLDEPQGAPKRASAMLEGLLDFVKPAVGEAMPPPGGVQLLRHVKEGQLAKIEFMLKSGAVDVNFQNHYGDSALILACWYGHVEITRALIDAKADVDMVNCDGNGALNCAAYHGFVNVASVLLQHGATVDIEDKVTGKTALIKAAYVGHAQVAQMLLQRGANKNLADNQGYTALAFATSFNHESVVSVLLEALADPNVQDEFGITPLIHAAARGHSAEPHPDPRPRPCR